MMRRVLMATVVGAGVLVALLGVQMNGRLGAIRTQTELLARAVEDHQQASEKVEADRVGKLLEAMGRTTAALEALVGERQDGASALGSAISSQSMEDAALMLSYSPDRTLRQHTIAILGQLGGEKAEKRLIEMMESDNQIQAQVLRALLAMGSVKLEPLVMRIMAGGSIREKAVAVGVLAEVLNRENLPTVLNFLEELPAGNNSTGNSLRQSTYGALRNLGDPAACRPLLSAALLETNEYTQRQAIQAMTDCATPAQLGILVEALEALGPAMGNNSTSSHQLIIARLGQMGDPRATPVLLDLLDSTNRSVAQQTVQALAQLKDPLATERIIEIANGPDNYAKQYLNGYINNGSNNGFPGVRKTEDGTYKMRKAETMSRLIKARQRMVARLEERYGPYNAKTKPAKGGDVQDLKKDEETGAPIAGKKQTAVAVEPEGGLDER